MESYSDTVEDSSEESFPFLCTICDKKNRHSRAVRYCVDCISYLCERCLEQHNDFPPMATHRMLSEEEMANADQHQLSVPTEKCPDHHGNLLDMFCEDHDAVCCSACALLKHRSCNDLVYIAKAATGFTKTSEYIEVLTRSKRVIDDLKDQVAICQDNKSKLSDECDDTINNIRKWTDDFRKAIEDLEASTMTSVKSRFHSKETNIGRNLETLDNTIEKIGVNLERVGQTADRNECKKFTNTKMLKQAIENGQEILEMSVGASQESLDFRLDPGTIAALSRVKALGNFFADDKVEKDASPCTGKFSSLIKIDKPDNGKEPRISGACILQNGDLILADFANKRLVRLGTEHNTKDMLALPGYPWDVCVTGPNEVAVTLIAEKQITMVAVENTMEMTKSFDVGEECLGMTCIHDFLYVCCWPGAIEELELNENGSSSSGSESSSDSSSSDDETSTEEEKSDAPKGSTKTDKPIASSDDSSSNDEATKAEAKTDAPSDPDKSEDTDDDSIGSIKVFNQAGALVSTLRHDLAGKAICTRPAFIAFDKDSSLVYISSFESGVTVATLDGQMASHLTTTESYGITVVNRNHVFVGESEGIMQIGPQGGKIGTALTTPNDTNSGNESDDDMEPVSVCYDKERARLVASYGGGNKIALFDIE